MSRVRIFSEFQKQNGCDTFGRKVSFLIGANGSGKSNALEAMRLLAMRVIVCLVP